MNPLNFMVADGILKSGSADPTCANYDVGNLLTTDPPRVTLIIVGMCGQKGVRNYTGGAAYGIDTLWLISVPPLWPAEL
jgi:hypothetical protein